MTTPSSNTQSNAQGSFGAMLQQARKTKQVSLEEAAGELFILKRHLASVRKRRTLLTCHKRRLLVVLRLTMPNIWVWTQ